MYENFHEETLYAGLSRVTLRFAPGTGIHYSNLNAALLGQALVNAAVSPCYEKLLTDRVLRPLKLQHTDCTPRSQHTGTWHGRPRPPITASAMTSAGALRSCGEDMIRYLGALTCPDAAELHEPVASPSLRQALRTVTESRLRNGRTGDELGLIWNIRRRSGGILAIHGGTTHGFSSFVGVSPTSGTALAVMLNSGVSSPKSPFMCESYRVLRELHEFPRVIFEVIEIAVSDRCPRRPAAARARLRRRERIRPECRSRCAACAGDRPK
ncbi:serine hydrolase domain-containing protein [Streptomyces sp. NPDC003327]